MDLIIRLPRIPKAGETILGGKSASIFGGKGANQAVAARRAGAEVGFIAMLGKDPNGDQMKSHFIKEGLPERFLLTNELEASGIAQIWVSEAGENAIAVAPGSNAKLFPADVESFNSEIQSAEVVLMQLETPLETVEFVAGMCSDASTKFILNPAPAASLSHSLLEKCWLITPNEHEASILSGIQVSDLETAEKAAIVLHGKGVENVLITLGENGSLLYSGGQSQSFPSMPVSAVDTTAAGDVFSGTLAAAISQGSTLQEAIRFASAAAAISVTREGAQPSIPFFEEINAILK